MQSNQNKKISRLRNCRIIQNKSQHTMICTKCNFFPIQQQFKQCIQNQSIFQIEWLCMSCKKTNILISDPKFKYYYNKNQLFISQNNKKGKQILFLVQISQSMKQNYTNLYQYTSNNSKKVIQLTKKQLMQQSVLLSAYMQTIAMQIRKNKGKYFNCDQFVKQKNISKIQYSLWLSDFLKQNLNNVRVAFFTQENSSKQNRQKNQKQNNSNNSKNRTLKQQLCEMMKNKKINNIEIIQLKRLRQYTDKIGQLIILSARSSDLLYGDLLKINQDIKLLIQTKGTIINLQQHIDALKLTCTNIKKHLQLSINNKNAQRTYNRGNGVNNEKNGDIKQNYDIQIIDHRMYQVQNIKQLSNFIKQYMILKNNHISIFMRKPITSYTNPNSHLTLNSSPNKNMKNNTKLPISSNFSLNKSNMNRNIIEQNNSHSNPKISLNNRNNNNAHLGSNTNTTVYPKYEWQKIIDDKIGRWIIKNKYKQRNQKIYKSNTSLINQQIKLPQILNQFIELVNKINYSNINSLSDNQQGVQFIQQYLNSLSNNLGKNNQFRVVLNINNSSYHYLVLWNNNFNHLKGDMKRKVIIYYNGQAQQQEQSMQKFFQLNSNISIFQCLKCKNYDIKSTNQIQEQQQSNFFDLIKSQYSQSKQLGILRIFESKNFDQINILRNDNQLQLVLQKKDRYSLNIKQK